MNKEVTSQEHCSFPDLFARAIADWPAAVDVHQITSSATRRDLYVVSGLGQLGDQLAAKYLGKPEEILMVNLHEAVCSTIRSAALFCTEVRPATLRVDAVKEEFKKRLRLTLGTPDLGWSGEDIGLANSFLLLDP